jgi:iron uptake system component EfeO
MPVRTAITAIGSAALLLALAACVPNNSAPTGDATTTVVTVDSSASACTVSPSEAPSGTITFSVTNSGDEVTEFYLLGDDKLRIVGEVENVGPGIERDVVVVVPPGNYFTLCKPGMTGDGVGLAPFTVTDTGTDLSSADLSSTGDTAARIATANANYKAYVESQIESLAAGTTAFAAAYTAGNDDAARLLYPATRVYWERVETVAESFGDLDPRMDLREADLEEGQEWTGWHAMEKDLWPAAAEPGFVAYSSAKRAALASQLVDDTRTLRDRIQPLEFSIDTQTNGAIGLLDEVASGKVTGEEEFWSHTDLWDFQANIDGARVVYEGVRDILVEKDAKLADRIDSQFAALQQLLDAQRVGDGFRLYTELSPAEIRAFSDQVNALAEPLSHLTGALVA